MTSVLLKIISLTFYMSSWAQESKPVSETEIKNIAPETVASDLSMKQHCINSLKQFRSYADDISLLEKACERAQKKEICKSQNQVPIFHVDQESTAKDAKKVLVFSLIHGDETPAGSVGRFWLERMQKFSPRNSWRIVPILNPDGVKLKTRTNANKVDLNRNFPTKDWDELALKYWKTKSASNERRFPGDTPASEPELKCALEHIDEYQPDFVVSIHTPLNVLDFDGPKVKAPNYQYLPWRSLGHYPGSLGRYLWHERKIPVLTTELKSDLPKHESFMSSLQDVIGSLVKLDEMNAQKKTELHTSMYNPQNSEH